MKYDFCESCYFYEVEPAICDACDEGDQYEPAEPEEGAFDTLRSIRFYSQTEMRQKRENLPMLEAA